MHLVAGHESCDENFHMKVEGARLGLKQRRTVVQMVEAVAPPENDEPMAGQRDCHLIQVA
jgi:hypothetical protein